MTAVRAAVILAAALSAGMCAQATTQSATIKLERRPCYGMCPVYSVTITGDGRVAFDGRQHVDSLGAHTAQIDASRVTALVRLFDEKDFFSLDSAYVMGAPHCQPYASDAPMAVTSIVSQGRTKRVEHDYGCVGVPPRLRDIELQIDSVAGTKRWIKG